MVSQDYQNIQSANNSSDFDASFASEVDLPVLPALNTKMNVKVNVARDGQVIIVHDEYLPYLLKWIEFDIQNKTATFVSESGAMQPLGFEIEDSIIPYLENFDDLAVIMKKEETIGSFRIVPLIKNDNYIN